MEPTIKHEYWKALKSPEIFRNHEPSISLNPITNSKQPLENEPYNLGQQVMPLSKLIQSNQISYKALSGTYKTSTPCDSNSLLSNQASIDRVFDLQSSNCSKDIIQRSAILSSQQQKFESLEAEIDLQKKQLLEQQERAKIVESCFMKIQEEIKQKSIQIEVHEKKLLEREKLLFENEHKLIERINEISSSEVKLQIRERQLNRKEEELRLVEIRVESKQAKVEKTVEMFERVNKRFNEEKKIILGIKKANEYKESLMKNENKTHYCDKSSLETLLNMCGIEDTDDMWSEEYSQKSSVFIN